MTSGSEPGICDVHKIFGPICLFNKIIANNINKEKYMKEMIAFCGIIYTERPTYQATQKNDNQARIKIAEEWSRRYKHVVKPEDVNCDGCLAVGKRQLGYRMILSPQWATLSISKNPGRFSCQSAKVRIGTQFFNRFPGLVVEIGFRPPICRSGF
jgi:hypothetical protein